MLKRASLKMLLLVIVVTLSTLVMYLIVRSNQGVSDIESAAQRADEAKTTKESDFSLPEDSKPPKANDVALNTDGTLQHELPESSESTTRRKESRAHTKAELKSLINAPVATVERVARYLGQADVAVMLDMLRDPRYQEDWGRLSDLLAHLDEGTEAQHAIIHLIQRGDVWPRNDRKLERFILMKISAVTALGHTNGDVARATARDALTENGATELAQKWLLRELPGRFQSNPDRVVALIRGRAAMGLVYSLDEESVQLVENLYESVAPRVKKQRERQKENSLGFYDLTLQEQGLDKLYSGLVDALAMRDLISDVGYEQLLLYGGDGETFFHLIGPYLTKYRIDDK